MSDGEARGKPSASSRRGSRVAVAAMGAGAGWAWPRISQHLVGDFDFEPLEDPPGFRRIAAGETSGMPGPFFGLEAPDEQDRAIPEGAMRADLCNGLFGGPTPAGGVPIASFPDNNCPFCRVLTERLSNQEERS